MTLSTSSPISIFTSFGNPCSCSFNLVGDLRGTVVEYDPRNTTHSWLLRPPIRIHVHHWLKRLFRFICELCQLLVLDMVTGISQRNIDTRLLFLGHSLSFWRYLDVDLRDHLIIYYIFSHLCILWYLLMMAEKYFEKESPKRPLMILQGTNMRNWTNGNNSVAINL